MSEAALFRDFAVVLLAAGAVALLFYYLKQPVVLGYLLAGFLVGPFSPGPSFVNDVEVMAFLGELGIVFLLFALGLEFNLQKLRKVGSTALIAGTIEIAIMLSVGYGLGQAFGWTRMQSVFLGAIMSISSTTVIVKVLSEMGKKDEDWAQTAFGILIIEDVLAVLILTALSGAGATGSFAPEDVLALVYKLGVFLGAALLLGLLAAPRIVDRLAFLKTEEVAGILAASIGVGMALLAGVLGFSAGLGAFVAGALMAESPRVAKLAHRIEPVRDLFTAVFFVTVGAALDPASLVLYWREILVVTGAIVVGKVFGVTVGTFVAGARPGKALRVGMTLAQIGEFAFIIAALAVTLGDAPPGLYAIAIAASAMSAFLTPYLIRASPRVVALAAARLPCGLHAYLRTYGRWVRRLGKSDQRDPEWRAIRLNTLTAALNAAVLIAVFAAGAAVADDLDAWLLARLSSDLVPAGAAWVPIALVALPFAYMWLREVQQVVRSLARIAVPQKLRQAEPTQTEKLLRRTFGLVATLGTAVFCVVFGSFLVPNVLPVLVAASLSMLVGGVVLGRSLRGFHREVERTIDRLAEGEGATREEAMHVLEEGHAWGAGSREVVLPPISGGAGRTIGQLRLRELTGACVLRVRSAHGEIVLNPEAAQRLRAGDVVMLGGEEATLARAEEILLGRDLGVEGGATEIVVQEGSRYAGRRLAALGLSAEVQVLVVRRGERTLAAEDDVVVERGDVLVVSGPDEAVDEATR